MNTKRNKTKTLLIVGLLLAVAGLTLGFAAFSNTLTIKSSATVTPDSSTFSVKFSSDYESLVEGEIVGNPNNESVTGTNGIINNNGNPTISGIEVNLIKPGDSIDYEFFIINTGEYDAYLNEVIYNNVEGENSNIVCKAVETGDETRATDALVEAACDGIKFGFNYYNIVGEDVEWYPIEPNMLLKNVKLPVESVDQVTMTIYYNKNAVIADGPFTVEIGDIEFVYSTVDVNATTTE